MSIVDRSHVGVREYADGTSVTCRYPFGTFVTARVLCSDGKVRRVARIAPTSDTFYSVPCSVRVAGKYVAGYLTVESREGYSTTTDSDPAVAKFSAFIYRKNGALLPRGTFRTNPTLA